MASPTDTIDRLIDHHAGNAPQTRGRVSMIVTPYAEELRSAIEEAAGRSAASRTT